LSCLLWIKDTPTAITARTAQMNNAKIGVFPFFGSGAGVLVGGGVVLELAVGGLLGVLLGLGLALGGFVGVGVGVDGTVGVGLGVDGSVGVGDGVGVGVGVGVGDGLGVHVLVAVAVAVTDGLGLGQAVIVTSPLWPFTNCPFCVYHATQCHVPILSVWVAVAPVTGVSTSALPGIVNLTSQGSSWVVTVILAFPQPSASTEPVQAGLTTIASATC